jgi:hypothetical protein
MGLEFLRAASNMAIFSSLDPSVAASSISFNSSSDKRACMPIFSHLSQLLSFAVQVWYSHKN